VKEVQAKMHKKTFGKSNPIRERNKTRAEIGLATVVTTIKKIKTRISNILFQDTFSSFKVFNELQRLY